MRFILLFVGAIASKAEELQISSSGFVLLQRPGVTYASVVDIDSAKGYPLSREPLQLPNSSDTSVGLLELQPVLEREAARVVLSGGWTRWTPRKAHLHPHGVHAFLSSVVVFDWCLFASAIMVFLILHMLVLGRLSARGWHLTVLMIWLFVGFVYNAIIWARFGSAQGISWFAGYLLEYIFLVENIFIFHIIIQAFKTPAKMTPKALHIVVWGQIMFQMVFFMGLAVWLRQIKVLPYILGVWLICCGFLAARGEHTMEVEIMETRACRCFTSCLGDRLSPYYQKDGECLLRDDSGRMQVSLLGLTTFVLLLADFLLEIDVVLTKIESGRYHAGTDLSLLAPPEITEEDRNASIDLSKQPPEKLFRLLAYELLREDQRPPEGRLGIRDFQYLTELGCRERLLQLMVETKDISEAVKVYHLNVTGTAGLYWLLHKFPDEHSWVWLLAVSQQRVLRKVNHHFTRAVSMALDDPSGCFSPNFRIVLMNAVATWKKIHGDYIALLWNSIAFGVLGDVTSWREVDEESGDAQEGPGGAPPNVSWSENLIFGNMWVASAEKWLEHHWGELEQAAIVEIQEHEAGVAKQRASAYTRWHRSFDGVLSSFEYLRRQVFGGWSLDKGLLRGLLRHVWRPGYGDRPRVSVGDFGAGGGRYSQWLNDTGLVQAFAFDGVLSVGDISGGSVQEVDLAKSVDLWRTFEWVLCLEVGQHMPRKNVQSLLRNLRRHAERGLVISWAAPSAAPSDASPASTSTASDGANAAHGAIEEAELVELVQRETGLVFDRPTTATLRAGCELDTLAKTVAIFRVPD